MNSIKVIPAVLLVALSRVLLKGDVWTFWTWYLLAAVLGFLGMSVTGRMFRRFDDKGWVFSKVLSIAVTGFVTWLLITAGILPFTTATCIGVTVACGALALIFYERERKQGFESLPIDHLGLVYGEELLFFALFLLWTYLAGFHPAAYGTEKFMDYGFMEAMMRSKTLPATDLWYSGGKINYYYGTVFCSISYQTFRNKGGADIQPYEDFCGRACFYPALFPCTSDGKRPSWKEK